MASAEKCRGGAGGGRRLRSRGAAWRSGQRRQSGRCERVAHGSPGSRRDEGGGGGRDDGGRRPGHGMLDSFRLWRAAPARVAGSLARVSWGSAAAARLLTPPLAGVCGWRRRASTRSSSATPPRTFTRGCWSRPPFPSTRPVSWGRARSSPALSASVPRAPPPRPQCWDDSAMGRRPRACALSAGRF